MADLAPATRLDPLGGAVLAEPVAAAPTAVRVRDLVALTKPRIAVMALIVGGGTWWMTKPALTLHSMLHGAGGLLGITLLVLGAAALNQVLERDVDALMERTKDRPLAARRLATMPALVFSLLLVGAALPLLLFFGNPLTLALGLLSLFLYVLVYTPMKQVSAWSLVVGAVPGAMPALLGATLATNTLEVVGLSLFGIVFLWQLPHFLAISIYREKEYVAAGHRLFPTELGIDTTKALTIATAAPLCALGVALWPLGVAGPVYALVAVLLGVWFCFACAAGFFVKDATRAQEDAWARRVFIGSLVYQTALFGALAVDRGIAAMFG